jgi:hypothetical protein
MELPFNVTQEINKEIKKFNENSSLDEQQRLNLLS